MSRFYKWLWLGIFAFFMGVFISLRQPQTPLFSPTPTQLLEVHFIDVGQGDSIFIRTPDGSTALIDGGPTSGNALGYLKSQNVTKLDIVIISHPHQDHIGGLVSVLNNFQIGGVWTSGASNTTRSFEQVLDIIEARRIPYHEVQTAETIPFSDLSFSVLYGVAENSNLNNTSLVLRLAYGQTSFLFTGDAEKAVEKILLSTSAQVLPATVLKIGHHGSYTSSSPAFVKAVSPQMAIYSAGKQNQYGHPHKSTLDTFASLDIPVYGTDTLGSIVLKSDGEKLTMTANGMPITSLREPGAQGLPFNITPVYVTPFMVQDISLQDFDCGHFATHEEAQNYFVAQDGPLNDPHRLDGDNDGIACESLP